MSKKQKRKKFGFTVMELVVVIVVIGILTSIVAINYGEWRKTTIINGVKSDINGAVAAMEDARNFSGDGYPTRLPSSFQSSDNFTLTGGSLDGGETYWIEGISDEDETIAYHIISTENEIKEGKCPIETFAVAWGGANDDYGSDIVQTSDGGYAITGETESFGESEVGAPDMYIAKYTHDGELQWNKTWGGQNTDSGLSIIQTTDGGYAVTGTTYSYGLGVEGSGDVFIAKYTSAGDLSWSKTWGSVNIEFGYSIIQTTDGGYAVTGSTQINEATTSDDAFIAKFDSSGNLSWDRIWGSGPYDCGTAIIQTSDGGYAVTGNSRRYSSTKSNDMFIAKYTSTGTLSWSKTMGGVQADYSFSIIQISNGGYIVTGITTSYSAGANADMYIAKFDSAGDHVSNAVWGGTGNEYGLYVIEMPDKGYMVTGFTKSYGSGNEDSFIAKYDSSLNHSWSKTFGGPNNDRGASIIKSLDGNVAVAGFITGSSYGAGGSEMFLAKYNSAGGIAGCSATLCRDITPSTGVLSGTEDSPTDSNIDPAMTVNSFLPAAISTSNPTVTQTQIVPYSNL